MGTENGAGTKELLQEGKEFMQNLALKNKKVLLKKLFYLNF